MSAHSESAGVTRYLQVAQALFDSVQRTVHPAGRFRYAMTLRRQ